MSPFIQMCGAHNAPLQNDGVPHNSVACVLLIATIYYHVASGCPAGQFITNSYNYLHTIIPRRRTLKSRNYCLFRPTDSQFTNGEPIAIAKKKDSKQTELYYPAAVTHARHQCNDT